MEKSYHQQQAKQAIKQQQATKQSKQWSKRLISSNLS
jgi:hypothetical protein